MQQAPFNLFRSTATIGAPPGKRRRASQKSTRAAAPMGAAAWYAPVIAPNKKPCDERRERMSLKVRACCLKIAYDYLDPNCIGVISPQTTRDIADEIDYLVRNKDEAERETQRYMVKHPNEYNDTKKEEEEALKRADDLDVTSEEEDEEKQSSDSDSDLSDFIVPDSEEVEYEDDSSTQTQNKQPQITIKDKKHRHIPTDDEEEHEEEEEEHKKEGTQLSEVD